MAQPVVVGVGEVLWDVFPDGDHCGGAPTNVVMHAAALGAELQVKHVVVPPYSGVFSAWGMGLGEPRADAAQTRVIGLSGSRAEELEAVFDSLEREVVAALVT